MKINGIELENINIFDPEQAKRYEDVLNDVIEKSSSTKGLKTSEVIRIQCELVNYAFDRLFGEGTSKNLFGDKMNLLVSLDAFHELTDYVQNQKNNLDTVVGKFSHDRAQRKSKKK